MFSTNVTTVEYRGFWRAYEMPGNSAFFFKPFPAHKVRPLFRWAGDVKDVDFVEDNKYDHDWLVYYSVKKFEAKHEK